MVVRVFSVVSQPLDALEFGKRRSVSIRNFQDLRWIVDCLRLIQLVAQRIQDEVGVLWFGFGFRQHVEPAVGRGATDASLNQFGDDFGPDAAVVKPGADELQRFCLVHGWELETCTAAQYRQLRQLSRPAETF